MRTYFLSAALLLASTGASAHGSGIWVGATVGFCLVQDPAYASLPGGKHWLQEESIPRFIASLPPELQRCLKANKATTAPLCRALLTPNPNDISNDQYKQMEAKYGKQIESFSTMNCGHGPR
ncbi:hypothetical protein [Massilia sp. CF038]|uniref:hypothetical protein n=1 Tax=Massilia sp. CF038 TaxID=1881045 RepID=UPI00091CF5D0|nr:hypothetical protein [Massilia sp. CF038]SHH26014.1 hypothetical protein SAMN05428948_3561 [Massilia sp. CF038]